MEGTKTETKFIEKKRKRKKVAKIKIKMTGHYNKNYKR